MATAAAAAAPTMPTLGQQKKKYDEKTLLERVSGMNRRQLFEQTYSALKLARDNYLPNWQDLADHLDPQAIRRDVYDVNRGDRRDQHIIDSEPRIALRTLQSGMHAGITSPARPWFKLTTPDPELAELPDVKAWLHTVTQRMLTVFLRSNLYRALPITYRDMGLFGVNATAIRDDFKDVMRAYHFPVGSYAFGLDERGQACTFVREYSMTVRQLLREFGGEYGQAITGKEMRAGGLHWENFSLTVRNLYERGALDARVTTIWFVCPNDDYDPASLYSKDYMPWRSCWFEYGRSNSDFASEEGFLRESGYRVFPVLCPRWAVTGDDTYSSDSPALTALGDVRSLQYIARKAAKAIDKALDPPVTASMTLRNQKVSLLPGDITYVDGADVRTSLVPVHEVRLEGLQFLNALADSTRMRVNRAFFADLFLMLAYSDYAREGGQPITAEEVRVRQEEKLIALGPVLEGINDELLDPLIDRTFDIMLVAGAIPEAPEALQGVDLKVEYLSIMAQAQKLVGVQGQMRLMQEVSAPDHIAAFPEMRHKLNASQWVDALGDKLGVDPEIIRTDAEAAKLAAAEKQAVQQAQQAEVAKTGAQAANLLSKTRTQGGTSTAYDDTADAMQRQQLGVPQ